MIGPEADVARFVEFASSAEDNPFLERHEGWEINNRETGQVLFLGESKWTPPLDFYDEMSELFPTLTFEIEWREPGECKFGRSVITGGIGTRLFLDDVIQDAKEKLNEAFLQRLGVNYYDCDDSFEIEQELTDGIMEASRQASQNHGEDRGGIAGVVHEAVAEVVQAREAEMDRGQQVDWHREGF